MKTLTTEAQRIADRDIYLKEDRFESPKEYFKLACSEITHDLPDCRSVVDVGCATGEFLYYLTKQMPSIQSTAGIDVVPDFFPVARQRLPQAQFFQMSIEDPDFRAPARYDLVTFLGVLGVIFDPELALRNLFSLTNSGGMIYLLSNFNGDPVDVHMAYRRAGVSDQWETGFNVYCRQTMEGLVAKFGGTGSWIDFRMPFAIAKGADPLRGWTEPFRDNPNTIIYGTSQFTSLRFLKVRVS